MALTQVPRLRSQPIPTMGLTLGPVCRLQTTQVLPLVGVSSPVVSQPRRDGRPSRAASTTAAARFTANIDVENAQNELVRGSAPPSGSAAGAQASVASTAATPYSAESATVITSAAAAVVASASARRQVRTLQVPNESCFQVSSPRLHLQELTRSLEPRHQYHQQAG
ncbi:unnamed protein product [Phytophthora fragariaefolia]|uniref:Unnamed protein product n=1 Tax=Phytophthora fragariaefolia TaxID=1490495 RepID=A0A9W6X2D8_9STRA|nr:unnamed protein product [Phytophthora fragariaefolia]